MKKTVKKLTLSRETLAKLDEENLQEVRGAYYEANKRTIWYECFGTAGCPSRSISC